jgi:hypothetical protein
MTARRLSARIKKLARGVLLTLLTVAVLAALIWYGDAPKVAALVGRFQPDYVLWFLLLTLAFEAVRWTLWHFLNECLAIRVPLRTQLFALAAGETAKFLPTGVYLQNFILQRSTGTDFGRSSAATTAMILAEIVVALLGVATLGIGAWTGWLRLAIVIGAIIAVLLVKLDLRVPRRERNQRLVTHQRIIDRVLEELRRFRAGAAALLRPDIMGITLLLTALYEIIGGACLYLVVRGLGIDGVSFWQAVAVNCFGLAFYVILGSLEAAEVGAFVGIGVSKTAAVSAILVNRALNVIATLILSAIVMGILRKEWRTLIRKPAS